MQQPGLTPGPAPGPAPGPELRPGRDHDAAAIITLIARCWADYPGCVLDVDAEAPELRRLASWFAGQGGALYVAEAGGDIAGMSAACPLGAGVWEMCRVYVHPARHGGGLGHRLLDAAEHFAIAQGATRLELWSDTRFLRAHRFYAKRGYRQDRLRVLEDLSDSSEYRFVRDLGQGPQPV